MKHAAQSESLYTDNTGDFAKMDDKAILAIARPLLQLLCEVGDEAAGGKQTWLSFGTTRKANSFTLTVHELMGSMAVFGETVLDVLGKAPEML